MSVAFADASVGAGHAWSERVIADCLTPFEVDKAKKVLARDYKPAGQFAIIDQGQDLIAGYTDDETALIRDELPIVVFGDHTRVFKFVDFPFVVGADGTKLLKPKPELDPRFFYFACLALDIPSRGYNRHFKILREQSIRYPEKTEQEKIAAVLWKIQKAVEIEDTIARSARDLKKSLLCRLFTHGRRGADSTELDGRKVPSYWQRSRFSDFATLHRGYDLPVQDRLPGTVPIVGSNGIVGHHSTAKRKGPGVATGRSGTMGLSFYIESDYWPLNTALYVEDFHGNEPLFVHYFFQSFDFERYSAGVSVPTLNRNLVHEGMIAVPDPDEQREIAEILQTVDRKIDIHESKKRSLQDLFKTMLNKLMTAQIRVNDLDIDTSEVKA